MRIDSGYGMHVGGAGIQGVHIPTPKHGCFPHRPLDANGGDAIRVRFTSNQCGSGGRNSEL
jgi:hypothetical protein